MQVSTVSSSHVIVMVGDGGGMKGGDNWRVSAQWSGAGDDGGLCDAGPGSAQLPG